MNDKANNYYEQSEFWSNDLFADPIEQQRIKEIIGMIPSDVQSILDVGCGNGAVINTIVREYSNRFNRIVGLDISTEALKHVQSEKYLGNVSQLPFPDSSFDLVISSEVLEHLSYDDFKKAILEIHRTSKKYIIVTVPNEEDLESELKYCPNCSCWFNQEYHMNSFNQTKLTNLFNQIKTKHIKEIGPLEEIITYKNITRLWFKYRQKNSPAQYGICPQCGYQAPKKSITNHDHPISEKKRNNSFIRPIKIIKNFLLKLLSPIILPKVQKKRWLLALYEKEFKSQFHKTSKVLEIFEV